MLFISFVLSLFRAGDSVFFVLWVFPRVVCFVMVAFFLHQRHPKLDLGSQTSSLDREGLEMLKRVQHDVRETGLRCVNGRVVIRRSRVQCSMCSHWMHLFRRDTVFLG